MEIAYYVSSIIVCDALPVQAPVGALPVQAPVGAALPVQAPVCDALPVQAAVGALPVQAPVCAALPLQAPVCDALPVPAPVGALPVISKCRGETSTKQDGHLGTVPTLSYRAYMSYRETKQKMERKPIITCIAKSCLWL